MDIEKEKEKFINLLRLSYAARKGNTNQGLILFDDGNMERVYIPQSTLLKYGFGDRDFWGLICLALEEEGYLKSFTDPNLYSVFRDSLERDSSYMSLKEEREKLDMELPPNYAFAELASNKSPEEFLNSVAMFGSEKEKVRRIKKKMKEISDEIDAIEKYRAENFSHEFVVNAQKLSETVLQESKDSDDMFIFTLAKDGTLCRRNKIEGDKSYKMESEKIRILVLKELIKARKTNNNFYNTSELATTLNVTEENIRKAVGGIKTQTEKSFNGIHRNDFIESAKNSGYRLHTQIRILEI